MKIPRKVFVREDRILALRALLMTACAASLWLVFLYTNQSEVAALTIGALTITLLLASAWIAFRPIPKNRDCSVSPTIKIPKPLIRRGFNSEKEPITYVFELSGFSENLHFVTNTRSGVIKRSWFDKDQWAQLKANIPENKEPDLWSASNPPQICLFIYIGFCAMALWATENAELTGSLGRLLYGAHNWTLLSGGEFYRLLSYSFLHHNLLHLFANVLGILVFMMAAHRSFSNFSITALIGFTAVFSAAIGTGLRSFDVMTGASGAIYGLLGFLIAAQTAGDCRLHPISRASRKRVISVVLCFELILSLTIEWYGGLIHIAGFASGYFYYCQFESLAFNPAQRKKRRHLQWAILFVSGVLVLHWAIATHQHHTHPYKFVNQLMAFNDPALTALAAPAVADNPAATRTQVEHAKAQALMHLSAISNNAVGVARADFWLGNNELALQRMRTDSMQRPDDEKALRLWLALEQVSLKANRTALDGNLLSAGTGGALLVSERGDYLARVPLGDQAIDLSKAIDRPPFRQWSLIARFETFPPGAEGIWPLKPNQYRTRTSAVSANP